MKLGERLKLACASDAASIPCHCSRRKFHISRRKRRKEGTFVGGVGVNDGRGAWICAEQVIYGEETAPVLNILKVLVVEGELSGVVVYNGDVEDIHCASRHELSAEHEAVWRSRTVGLQTVLNIFAVAYSNAVRTYVTAEQEFELKTMSPVKGLHLCKSRQILYMRQDLAMNANLEWPRFPLESCQKGQRR